MTDPNQTPKYRLRLIFAKNKQVKYISHLDLALTWERALRRAQMPIVYSQGFNPRPKMQFASGLPLGTTGSAEILDIIIDDPLPPEEVYKRISPVLPKGISLKSVKKIPLKAATMQQLLHQAEYRVIVETDLSAKELNRRIKTLLSADKIIQMRRRRKKEEEFDMRPWLHDLRLETISDGDAHLYMRLTTGQFGNLRPETVLKALDLAENWAEIERTLLIFKPEPSE